jgi:hypothetical protein
MVDLASIWSYVHSGIGWIRDITAKAIPFNNDVVLLGIALLVAMIIKRSRIIDTVALVIMIILLFLLMRLG